MAQKDAGTSETTVYVGGGYERLTRVQGGTSVTEHVHYIRGAGETVAVFKRSSAAPVTSTRYLHRDHLGSVVALTHETGGVVERYSFDPWGKRRDPVSPSEVIAQQLEDGVALADTRAPPGRRTPVRYDASMAAIDPSQAADYLARWTRVAEQETVELRTTSMGVKFRQLCALFESRAMFPPDPAEQAEIEAVRARWSRIRAAYHG